jgi:hypothetical protein
MPQNLSVLIGRLLIQKDFLSDDLLKGLKKTLWFHGELMDLFYSVNVN